MARLGPGWVGVAELKYHLGMAEPVTVSNTSTADHQLGAALDHIALLRQQLTLAEARLHAAEHTAERWRAVSLANERLHGEALAELEKLKGTNDVP